MKWENEVITKTLSHFVKHMASLPKSFHAGMMQFSHSVGDGFTSWKHAVQLYLREYMDADYAEIIDGAEKMKTSPNIGSASA